MLNNQTLMNSLEDKGGHKHLFFVRCGESSKDYEISADDNRSRNEWLLAIKKVALYCHLCIQAFKGDYYPHPHGQSI